MNSVYCYSRRRKNSVCRLISAAKFCCRFQALRNKNLIFFFISLNFNTLLTIIFLKNLKFFFLSIWKSSPKKSSRKKKGFFAAQRQRRRIIFGGYKICFDCTYIYGYTTGVTFRWGYGETFFLQITLSYAAPWRAAGGFQAQSCSKCHSWSC